MKVSRDVRTGSHYWPLVMRIMESMTEIDGLYLLIKWPVNHRVEVKNSLLLDF